MPYIKKERDRLSKLLGAYQLENSRRLSEVLSLSPSAALRRIKSPEELSVAELRRLNTHAHIPIEEIRNAL